MFSIQRNSLYSIFFMFDNPIPCFSFLLKYHLYINLLHFECVSYKKIKQFVTSYFEVISNNDIEYEKF